MNFGLVHYNAPGRSLEEFLDFACQTGFTHIELQSEDVWPAEQADSESCAETVRRQLDSRCLRASALAAGNDFVVLEKAAVAAQVARMELICRLATLVGAPVVRIDGGWPKDSVPEAKWMEAITRCLGLCLDFVAAGGLRLALDNHGVVTNNAEFQLEVLERVNSPALGLNLDTMNYRWFGHDLGTLDRYHEMVAGHVFHTHLKDGRGSRDNYVGTALGEGEIHLDHAVRCLKRSGYRGVWCTEYEGAHDPAEGYRKGLAWMREHVGG